MKFTPYRAVWLSWYSHRRTDGICEAWGLPLEVIETPHGGVIGWIIKSFRTIRALYRIKPDLLFVQNPSLGLTILAIMCRRLFRYSLVVDAHNEGVRPFVRSSSFVRILIRWILRKSDKTIVTNSSLASSVIEVGGRPLVLPDPLPDPPATENGLAYQGHGVDVVVICTYAPDEPISEILTAAETMPDTRFACTGNVDKFNRLGLKVPSNVFFTGFVSDNKYWALLRSAAVICDLTLMSDCLVCGAYEALAVARPMVLSSNPATVEIFGSVAVMTEATPSSIASALQEALHREAELSARAVKESHIYRKKWESQSQECLQAIQSDLLA